MSTLAEPAWDSELVRQFFDRRTKGFFLDIGANDPKDKSQSWLLEQQGWGGILVEDHLYNLKIHRHIMREGYRLVKRTGLNNWYIPFDQPFKLSSLWERIRLWKKVWLNTPFHIWRVRGERRRAAKPASCGKSVRTPPYRR